MTQLHLFDTSPRCLRCGRRLSDPVSIARGYGPECWGKRGKEKPVSIGDVLARIDKALKFPNGELLRREIKQIRGMVKEMEGR